MSEENLFLRTLSTFVIPSKYILYKWIIKIFPSINSNTPSWACSFEIWSLNYFVLETQIMLTGCN